MRVNDERAEELWAWLRGSGRDPSFMLMDAKEAVRDLLSDREKYERFVEEVSSNMFLPGNLSKALQSLEEEEQ